MQIFILQLFKNPLAFITIACVVIFSICCHEFAHALVAYWCGDDTAVRQGRLTLNPFKQMGVMSLIMFCLVGIAWGTTPVNRSRLQGRFSAVWVALAGPLTNLLLSQIFLAILFSYVKLMPQIDDFAVGMIAYASMINIVLAILNSLPLPRLDGWHVLVAIFPKIEEKAVRSEFASAVGFILIVVVFSSFDRLSQLAYWIISKEAGLIQTLIN